MDRKRLLDKLAKLAPVVTLIGILTIILNTRAFGKMREAIEKTNEVHKKMTTELDDYRNRIRSLDEAQKALEENGQGIKGINEKLDYWTKKVDDLEKRLQ